MTKKQFLNAVAHGREDVVQLLLDVLTEAKARYCVIGGLAVNAYAEPVVSLDLDIIVVAEAVDDVCARAKARGLKVRRFEHSVNLTSAKSDLRVQIQTDDRYQAFLERARPKNVLGYRMRVAAVEDVVAGKVWAWQDETRRPSKRQKDLADILRLVEARPELADALPRAVRAKLI